MKEGTRNGVRGSVAAALLESMRAVQRALLEPPGIPPHILVQRIEEWRQLVQEMAEGSAQGAELATLYEMSQALNSSLNLSETLEVVMDSLIHLTGAERGCLMMLDEDGNLEIRAAQNFDQQNVEASDMELSHTVVRKAVEEGQPVLTTNAQIDPRFSGQESVIGYQLRSIVCVPLHVRGQVIGALYLDNRIREGVFSEADLPILKAFANQAAVAIENARLYTMTDQALAARVEELTTLQKIDQELNASLDIGRVLDLTLSWAMRATGAKGGTLSVLDNEGNFQMVSHQGNGSSTTPGPDALHTVMTNRQPVIVGNERMLVPIRSKDRVIGLLDLQGNGDGLFQQDHVQLVSRLADHAAVAIENARLYEKVRQANLAKSEFVSVVSHELRTPMTSIRGYADLLAKGVVGPLTPQQKEFIHTILSNVERMQVLVSDLRDISRIETGQLRLEMEAVHLRDALESALEATQAQIKDRSQELKIEVPEDLPPVYADPNRLAQILTNLLSNANKYTPEGGSIAVRAWLEGGYVHCSVSDTGIGMSPEDQARLFTKFFRSENPAVREQPGTGLGLCIVKSLVELQGGTIEVKSQIGKGTTFTFTVPVAVGK